MVFGTLNLDLHKSLICDIPLNKLGEQCAVGVHKFGCESMGRILQFISTHHCTDIKSESHVTAKKAIEKHHPKFLIIEGLRTDASKEERQAFIESAKQRIEKGEPVSEQQYAAYIADKHGIPIIGGEPWGETAFMKMKEKGYSAKDVMALYMLTSVCSLKRDGIQGVELEKHLRQFAERNDPRFSHLSKSERLSYEEFKAVYEPKLGKSILQLEPMDYAPCGEKGANFFQRLNCADCRMRNEHLLEVIARSQTLYDNVMVVFGEGHIRQLEPALHNMLGKKGVAHLCHNQQLGDVTPTGQSHIQDMLGALSNMLNTIGNSISTKLQQGLGL